LERLGDFISGMEFFRVSYDNKGNVQLLSRDKVDSLINGNKCIGFNRFSLKNYVLTEATLERFLKYRERCTDYEEVNDKWVYDNISFKVPDFEDTDEDEEDEEDYSNDL